MCSIPLREQPHLHVREAVAYPPTDIYSVSHMLGDKQVSGRGGFEGGREGYEGEKASSP